MEYLCDYPPGAMTDPSAPYNQDEIPCPHCQGTGILGQSADEEGIYMEECPECDGTGIVQPYKK